jgi:hypothetical protein
MNGRERLVSEVFTLAYHLHWSPESVLALPVPDRTRYLELLRVQLEREAASLEGGPR